MRLRDPEDMPMYELCSSGCHMCKYYNKAHNTCRPGICLLRKIEGTGIKLREILTTDVIEFIKEKEFST